MTRTLVVAADSDPPSGQTPTVLRVRVCLDCGELLASAERLVPLSTAQRRIRDLTGERVGDARRLRKAIAPTATPA